jgi:hypothetical protein
MGTLAGLPSINSNVDKNTKSIIGDLASITGHGFATIITVTDGEDFIKKYSDRSRKESRPDWLNGIRKITYQTINVGHDYNKMIENQLKKLGQDPAAFNPEACKYSHKFSDNGIIRQNNSDENQFYVRYFTGVNEITRKSYEEVFVNAKGDVVPIDQVTKAKWFNGSGGSIKQAAAGIEKEIQPRNLKIDNLFYFARGDTVINRLPDELMRYLDLVEK